ncbi:MAG: divalent-cation tolerance protein CutA, partial [Campylobacterales bacterium]
MQLVVFCTAKNRGEAEYLSKLLLEKKLCACVNISDSISSHFFWDNEVQSESEAMMIIKTSSRVYDKVEIMIKEHHSYDVPEI